MPWVCCWNTTFNSGVPGSKRIVLNWGSLKNLRKAPRVGERVLGEPQGAGMVLTCLLDLEISKIPSSSLSTAGPKWK